MSKVIMQKPCGEWSVLAEQGDADAQTLLGAMHLEEKGVPQNTGKAAKRYRLAITSGTHVAHRGRSRAAVSGHTHWLFLCHPDFQSLHSLPPRRVEV